jgi:hypothetical protein
MSNMANMTVQETQELTNPQYQSFPEPSHPFGIMGGTRKPSGRGRKNSDKQPAHPPGMGMDPAYPPGMGKDPEVLAQYQQQLKQEQDSDDAAAAGTSTPGPLVSSSPMAPLSSSSAQMVLPIGRRKTGGLICWNYTNKPVPYKANGNGRQRGRNLIQWIRRCPTATIPLELWSLLLISF